jgi:hypothetical protein
VIVPIGPVPRSVVEEYTASISKFAHMSLSAARSFYRESEQKTPFANMEWSSAFMHFHFLDVSASSGIPCPCRLLSQQQHVW